MKLLSFFILLVLSGCSGSEAKPKPRSFPIAVEEIVQKDTPIYIETIGHVDSGQEVNIRAQVTGLLVTAHMNPGDKVKQGDLLFTLDTRSYQAILDQAKATLLKDEETLKLAEVTVKRYAALVEKDYVSKLNFDQYSTDVEIGKAQVMIDKALINQAQVNLDYCLITSPIDGRAGDINIDPGNLIVANDTASLTVIRQISPADVRFSIPQRDFFVLKTTNKRTPLEFEAILPQDTSQARKGTVYFIDNTLDITNGTVALRGTLPNDDELFWPGEFIRVRLQTAIKKGALLAPSEAVKIGQNGHYVYIYDAKNSTVSLRRIVIGERIDGFVIIEQGVAEGEQVVTRGQLNLRDGSSVYIASIAEQPVEVNR